MECLPGRRRQASTYGLAVVAGAACQSGVNAVGYSCGRGESEIFRLHPYDLPEVIALPVSEGSVPYLRWVVGQSGGV